MSENKEPDWLGELTKGGGALHREAMRIVKAAEETAAGGPARPLTRRIVRAVGAGIRELAAPEPVVHELTLATTVTGTASLTRASARSQPSGASRCPRCASSARGQYSSPA